MKSQLHIISIAVTLSAVVLLIHISESTEFPEDGDIDWITYPKNSLEFHPIYRPVLTAHLDERPDEELNSLLTPNEQNVAGPTIAPIETPRKSDVPELETDIRQESYPPSTHSLHRTPGQKDEPVGVNNSLSTIMKASRELDSPETQPSVASTQSPAKILSETEEQVVTENNSTSIDDKAPMPPAAPEPQPNVRFKSNSLAAQRDSSSPEEMKKDPVGEESTAEPTQTDSETAERFDTSEPEPIVPVSSNSLSGQSVSTNPDEVDEADEIYEPGETKIAAEQSTSTDNNISMMSESPEPQPDVDPKYDSTSTQSEPTSMEETEDSIVEENTAKSTQTESETPSVTESPWPQRDVGSTSGLSQTQNIPASPEEADKPMSAEADDDTSSTDNKDVPMRPAAPEPKRDVRFKSRLSAVRSEPTSSEEARDLVVEKVEAESNLIDTETPRRLDSTDPKPIVPVASDSASHQSAPIMNDEVDEQVEAKIAAEQSTSTDINASMMSNSPEPQPDVASETLLHDSEELLPGKSKMFEDIYTIVLYSVFCFVSIFSISFAKNILGSSIDKVPSVSEDIKPQPRSNNMDSRKVKQLQTELHGLKDRNSQLVRKLREQEKRRPIIEEVKRLKSQFGPNIRNVISEKRSLLRNIHRMKRVQEENDALKEKVRLAMYEQLVMILVWVDLENLPTLLDNFKFRSKAENLEVSSMTMQVEAEFLEDHTKTLEDLRMSYIEELKGIDEEIVQVKQRNCTTKEVLRGLRQNNFSDMMGQVDNLKRKAGELDSESELYYRGYLMLFDSIIE